MSDTPDLSKIVSLIMENPHIVSEIQSLVKSGTDGAAAAPEGSIADETVSPAESPDTIGESSASTAVALSKREKRARLFSGLKPYLSSGRQRTVDTVLTFADMLETVRGK